MSKFIIDPQSSYYLHPLEGPGILITVVCFDGKNYDVWERAIRMVMKAKNKLGFINGTLTKPEDKKYDSSEL